MGCTVSYEPSIKSKNTRKIHASNEDTLRDEFVSSNMKSEAELEDQKVKLLILGTAESGKSTIFKQMKLQYGRKFSERQRKQAISIIHNNVIHFMKCLCDAAITLELLNNVHSKEELELVRQMEDGIVINKETAQLLKQLWSDSGIQMTWNKRNQFQIVDSTKHFFNKLDVISDQDYFPNQEDMLYLRVKTTEIVTERHLIDGIPFEIYDVAGQRALRRKWIHCFDSVTAVIFVAAISEYDQKIFEDGTTNRMVESLNLFEEICNNRYFVKSSMILFLNKMDLFADKIKKVDIKSIEAFSDYQGKAGDVKDGSDYFIKKFIEKNKKPKTRKVYTHLTCATDTQKVSVVLDACKDIILNECINSKSWLA